MKTNDPRSLSKEDVTYIRLSYRDAKDQTEQIKILKELFLLKENDVRKIVGLPEKPEKKKKVNRPPRRRNMILDWMSKKDVYAVARYSISGMSEEEINSIIPIPEGCTDDFVGECVHFFHVSQGIANKSPHKIPYRLEVLKKARECGSVADVARELGLSYCTVKRWEKEEEMGRYWNAV